MMATPRGVPVEVGREWLDGEVGVGRGKAVGPAPAPSTDAAFLALVLAALQGHAQLTATAAAGNDVGLSAGEGAEAGAVRGAEEIDLAAFAPAGDGVALAPLALPVWQSPAVPAQDQFAGPTPILAEPNPIQPGPVPPGATALAGPEWAAALPSGSAANPGPDAATAHQPLLPGSVPATAGTASGSTAVANGDGSRAAAHPGAGAPDSKMVPMSGIAAAQPQPGGRAATTAHRPAGSSLAAEDGSLTVRATAGAANPDLRSTAVPRPAAPTAPADIQIANDGAAGTLQASGPDRRSTADVLEPMAPAADRPGAVPTLTQPPAPVDAGLPLTRTLSPSRLLAAVTAAVKGARPGRYVVSGTLEPPRLGRVHVNIELTGGTVRVQCTVASPGALQALGNQEAALRALLADAGVVLAGYGVAFAAGGGGGETGGHDAADAEPGGTPTFTLAPPRARTGRVQRLQTLDYRA